MTLSDFKTYVSKKSNNRDVCPSEKLAVIFSREKWSPLFYTATP